MCKFNFQGGQELQSRSGLKSRILDIIKEHSSPFVFCSALALTGCEIPQEPYTYHNQRTPYSSQVSQVGISQPQQSSDGLFWLASGLLLGELGIKENNPGAVFAGDALVGYSSAMAGRSQVNVNVNPPANVNPPQSTREPNRDLRPSQLQHKDIKRVQLARVYDLNKNGRIDIPSDITLKDLLKDNDYFDENSTLILVYPHYYEGKITKPVIKIQGIDKEIGFVPKYIKENSDINYSSFGQSLDINDEKKFLISEGKFGEGGEKIHTLEVYVNEEKIPTFSRNFLVNFGKSRQSTDQPSLNEQKIVGNIGNDPELGKYYFLACEQFRDNNKNGSIEYPEEFVNISDRFPLGRKFNLITAFPVKLRYIRARFTDSLGAAVYDGQQNDTPEIKIEVSPTKPGKYKYESYYFKYNSNTEKLAGTKEIEIFDQTK